LELLQNKELINVNSMKQLQSLLNAKKYRKALKLKLPRTSKAHTIRGLCYAQIGWYKSAMKEFALAMALDTGNDLARRALLRTAKTSRLFSP
jgi:tetratricopeptide (TPR) repeat protein